MTLFKVELSPVALKSFKKLDPAVRTRIQAALNILADNPKPPAAKQLVDSPYWRVRIGDYRILYEIKNSELLVFVIEIGHRSKISRKL